MAIPIIQALWFFVPAYLANMMPVFVQKLPFLNKPVDFGRTLAGKRILGGHKTWRGLFFGTLAGFLVFELQRFLFSKGIMTGFALIDYSTAPLFLGALIGFGALVGDIVKSFFKRRVGVRPGGRWMPFDQIDFIAAALLVSLAWSKITLNNSLVVLLVVFCGAILFQYLGYWLKLKKELS